MKKHQLSILLFLLCAITAAVLSAVVAVAADPVTGGFTVTGGSEGTDYEWRGDRLVILTDTPVTIQNRYAAETVTQTILIGWDNSANVTLDGIRIAAGDTPAVQIDGTKGNVTLTLKGENVLTGGYGHAAIEKNGLTGKLVLTGKGSLTAYGGNNAPGIGSLTNGTHVEFTGGVITAVGGKNAASDIGTNGGTRADIRISSTASVKGSCSNQPLGLSQERIGQYVLENPGGETVTVDGTELPYQAHPDEDRLYLWLPVGDHTVKVGSSSKTVPVESAYGLKVSGGVEGTDYLYNGDELQILTSVPMTVANTDTGSSTKDMIYVAKDVDADLTLAGVNIDSRGGLRIADNSAGNVQIRLAEGSVNMLRASSGAGLQKNGANGSLTISGKGSLDASGGFNSAGIGGGFTYYDESVSRRTANITIADGVITAHGGAYGAGIGSGNYGIAENLTFTGGTVEAYGNEDSAGIGSGDECDVINITITGGSITAHAGSFAAGIGSGERGAVKGLHISGGTVTAYSGGGAAIGSGESGAVDLIEISGGTVTAYCANYDGSGIGSSMNGYADSVRISGGTVTAISNIYSVGIGSSKGGHISDIAITGGNVSVINSRPDWGENNIAIGTASDDELRITVRDCVLTAEGIIGSTGNKPQTVTIGENTTVKTVGILTTPKNESGESVYPLRIENPMEETVKINGVIFPFVTHNEEKALYPYRPGKELGVSIGTNTQYVPFDPNTGAFSAAHVPADERTGAVEPTCTKDGYTGDIYCIGCGDLIEKGETIAAPGHDCTITVTREATLTKPGEVQCHCTVCGADYKAAQRCVGDFIVSGIESDGDVSFSGGVLTVQDKRTLMIQNIYPNGTTTARIAVADGVRARIILNGVNIDSRSVDAAAFFIADGSSGDVRIELADGSINQLYSGSECAGLQKNDGSGTLTITGSGTLIAVGGSGAAGIGSGKGHLLRNLIIENGHISASGGTYGAGIGSGLDYSAKNIRITGGMITAFGGSKACGIGHGYYLFGAAKTENLVIGPMASVKAKGASGALGTTPVNEAGERVSLHRYGIPENSYLQIDRQRFPYTYHDGEAQVYVYLTPAQTAEPHAEGGTQLQGGTRTAAVLMTPSVKANENTKANLTVADAAGLDELAEQYADEGKTVIVTLTIEETDETDSADELRKEIGRSAVECFGLTLTKQANGNEPEELTETDTLLTLTIPFDFDGVDKDSVCVLRYLSGAEKLEKDPANGGEGYSVDPEAGTVTIFVLQISDLAIAYDLTAEPGKPAARIPKICRLSFDTDGGSLLNDVYGAYGIVVKLDKYVPVKEGCDFGGWYGDEAPSQPLTSIQLTGNRTLRAKWIASEGTEPEAETSVETVFRFLDVAESDPFFEDVQYVDGNGLMIGVSDDRFAPDANLSRAMLVTVLYRLEGEPEVRNGNIFPDVEEGSWYEKAVVWAYGEGIVLGYDTGRFGPSTPVTREQLATILYRYTQYKGCDVSVDENTNFLSFWDVFEISEYAQAPMFWALDNNLIDAAENGWLYPADPATRAVVATFLHRFCEAFEK